jgi:hypothetical protein
MTGTRGGRHFRQIEAGEVTDEALGRYAGG